MAFQPTPSSMPPLNTVYRPKLSKDIPVNFTPLNPVLFILRAASIYADKIALVHQDVPHPITYTFAVWAQRIQNLAYALIEAGIRPGDRVALIAPNCPLIADAHFGVLAARAVITPINTRLTKPEVDYILQHSEAKLILVDHEFTSLVAGTSARVIVSQDTGRESDTYEEFLTSGRRFSNESSWSGLELESDEHANAALCYTSGTTGKPKGVVYTFRGCYLAAMANVIEAGLHNESIYLWTLPMFHACGWTYSWANVLAYTTQITIRAVRYDIIWKHLKHSGVTHYCAAPTVQIGILNAPQAYPLPMHRRVCAIVAGSAPTAHLIGELEGLNIQPIHVYGLTETYGPYTRNYAQSFWQSLSLSDRAKLMARQGHGFATAEETRVVTKTSDGSFSDVPENGKTLGELVVRGNTVMKEYFKDVEATAKAFQGGYFLTGDLAVRYPDHSVFIQDRSKDIIISGGENASSLAIEQEIASHPDVLEVAVVARPHPKWGERPSAFVVLKESSPKWREKHEFESALQEWLRGKLPGFAIPEWVDVVEELPKTSTGKIQKNVLRQRIKTTDEMLAKL